MKLPNGYGSVVKLSGKRRKPWMVRKTTGYRIDPIKEKKVNEYIIIGYAATKTEGLQMLADYNRNPYDTKAAKMTFDEVYEEWSKKKFPTVSESNIKGYKASYKTCGILYNRVFKDLKLADLQQVIDTCGKNFPTLKKIKILFNQLYEFDCGKLSGWMYNVNGWYPNYGCSQYEVSNGDVIQWRYTCDLGRDVGDSFYE